MISLQSSIFPGSIRFSFCILLSLVLIASCSNSDDTDPSDDINNDQPLTWSTPQGLQHGHSLIITTDGTYNFGGAPTLFVHIDLTDHAPGEEFDFNFDGAARGEVIGDGGLGAPIVRTIPELPHGKGFEYADIKEEVGSTSTRNLKMQFISDESHFTEFFEHAYLYWPLEHQEAAFNDNAVGGRWNFKSHWWMRTGKGHSVSEATDLFMGGARFNESVNGGPTSWTNYRVNSNDSPLSTADRGATGWRNENNIARLASAPFLQQSWIKFNPDGNPTGSEGDFLGLNSSTGEKTKKDYTDGLPGGGQNNPVGFDRVNIPGYVRGWSKYGDKDYSMYMGDYFANIGENAASRVEITDSKVYDTSTRKAICIVKSWKDNEIQLKINSGIFYNESLHGKHLWITLSDNQTRIYVGEL
ncbi:MAG: hypothetical protein MI922_01340 [Bacteroidales bacterium]|nr:hypothetical protein [Bacteroidales bacterium]